MMRVKVLLRMGRVQVQIWVVLKKERVMSSVLEY